VWPMTVDSGSFGAGGTLMVPTGGSPEGGYIEFDSTEYYDGVDWLPWGVFAGKMGGNYAGPTSNDWIVLMSDDFIATSLTEITRMETRGTVWNNTTGLVEGTTVGYGAYADNPVDYESWISVGETIGNINTGMSKFEAVTVGTWIETTRYIQMAQTINGRSALDALRIPFIEIGRANMSGSFGGTSVQMNDVIYFTHPTATPGATPELWATGDVQGSYSTPPVANNVVQLNATSGGALTADFRFQQFDDGGTNGWVSTIENGAGTLSGGSYNGSVKFEGAAAGGINPCASTFSGTAAGIAAP
ncbi:MAG: hypothetical protein V3T30_04925, partial [Thermodesulfobacteriota bacterium]